MATLWEDVVGHTAYDLQEMAEAILEEAKTTSPRDLVNKAIRNTLAHMEEKYDIIAKGACNSDGTSFYATDIGEEFWRVVNT